MILSGHLFVNSNKLDIDYKEYLGPDWKPSVKGGAIIISNHISWLDFMTVVMKYFPRFVARADFKDLFAIGSMAKAVNCIYVDR